MQDLKQQLKQRILSDLQGDQFEPIVFKIYEQLIVQAQTKFEEPSQCELLLESISFLQELLALLNSKSTDFRTYTQSDVAFLQAALNFIFYLSHILMGIIDKPIGLHVAHSGLPSLFKIYLHIKQFFQVDENTNLIEKLYTAINEGIDSTSEKVFETPHPYPRTEFHQQDQVSSGNAIGFVVELDKRSHTEKKTEYLQISTLDHDYWINDNFGTFIKFVEKPQLREPVIMLGNKLKIEFHSYPQ